MIDIFKSIKARNAMIAEGIPGIFDVAYSSDSPNWDTEGQVAIYLAYIISGRGTHYLKVTHSFINDYGDDWLEAFRVMFVLPIKDTTTKEL